MIADTDERQNKPSSSGLERLSLCPGSLRACAGLPDMPTADSDRGSRIHAALVTGDVAEDIAGDFEIHHEAEQVAAFEWEGRFFGAQSLVIIHRERRMWSKDGSHSGQPDYIIIVSVDGKLHALILDHKTGWNPTDPEPSNMQLSDYAVLLDENDGPFESITVGIIQPKRPRGHELVTYLSADIADARAEIGRIIAAAQMPDAPLVPGEKQCQFCRAMKAGTCPALTQLATQFDRPTSLAKTLTPAQVAAAMDGVGPVKQFCKAVEDRAKELAAEGNLPGWTLKPGNINREVPDMQAAFTALHSVGFTPDEFRECCAVKIGKLETVYRQKTGCKKKDVKPAVEGLLAGLIEYKQNAPSLARLDD